MFIPRLRRTIARWMLRIAMAVMALIVTGVLYEDISARRDVARFPPPGRLVKVGGRRLHVLCAGEGSPAVLLEATGVGSSIQYTHIQREIAAHTLACAYDRAGMGWSDPNPEPLSARVLANDLDALVADVPIPPPYVLVAGSAGGLMAELYAREHPQTVVALVFLDALTGSFIDAQPEALARLAGRACAARVAARAGILRLFDPFELRKIREPDRDLTIALTYRTQTWDSVCSLMNAASSSAAQIRAAAPFRPDLPIVVLRHERIGDLAGGGEAEASAVEPLWQAEQAKLATASSRGELVVARGSGHLIASERPDLVIAAIMRMLNSVR